MDKLERIQSMYEYLRDTGQVHTRKDLAEKVGATPSNVASALRGEPRCLTDNLLRRINQAFGYIFNERWLITGEGEMMAENSAISSWNTLKSSMLDSLIEHYADGNKSRFAAKLGIRPQTISTWYARDTFDAELIYAKCEGVSGDWLLSGEGEMMKSNSRSSPIVQEQPSEPSAWDSFISLIADEVRRRMRDE